MIVLDTNVIAAVMRRQPDPAVVDWLDRQPAEALWTTAVTVCEVRFGLELLDPGTRRRDLEAAFGRALEEDFEGRILPFDRAAAWEAAALAAERRRRGRTVEIRDTQIAGIVIARRGVLATGNTRHFQDLPVKVVDPWGDGR
ncbi:MAG: type II toxin-antitoxin system VapC family toxin [Magnetospirillum sp. WYHS-4]